MYEEENWDDDCGGSSQPVNQGTWGETNYNKCSDDWGDSDGNSHPGFQGSWGETNYNKSTDNWGERGGNSQSGSQGRQGRSNRGGFSNNYNRNQDSQGSRGSREGRSWGQNNFARNDDNSMAEDKICMDVESCNVGRIIGKGGNNIRSLEEQSGARIKVNRDGGGSSSRVEISGSAEAQNKARDLINDIVNRSFSGPRQQNRNNFDQRRNQNQNQTWNQREETTSNEADCEETNDKPAGIGQIDWGKAARDHEEYQRLKWAKYPPIVKNFYKEDPAVANLSEQEVEKIRFDNNKTEVRYTFEKDDFKIPNPVTTFEQAFSNYPDILTEIYKQGFEKPSPIQAQAWPILLSGKDMIGIAQTGTGKTLAFLLPALLHIDGQTTPRKDRAGPTVLVMAPTRELAQQIEKEVNKYYYHGIKAVCVYGGGDRKGQIAKIGKGVEIVIATPGRLNDLTQAGELEVSCVSYLILDEADRMLDMGFEPQIRKTLLDVRPDRHTVMTSATWPTGVRRLAESYMKNPVTVCIGSLDLAAVKTVTQTIHVVDEEEKPDMLKEFLTNLSPDEKAIVFFNRKTKVDDVGSEMALQGINCQSIHGGREQCDREQALQDIKDGYAKILLATDVASRGIDIEDITYVFNYDFPKDAEEYVHRIGRTGRAGRNGESISLFTRRDWALAAETIRILEDAQQGVPEELYDMADRYKAWKKRKDEEDRQYGGRGGRRGGGSRYRRD